MILFCSRSLTAGVEKRGKGGEKGVFGRQPRAPDSRVVALLPGTREATSRSERLWDHAYVIEGRGIKGTAIVGCHRQANIDIACHTDGGGTDLRPGGAI